MSKFPYKPNPPYIPDPYIIPQHKLKVQEMKTPEQMAEEYLDQDKVVCAAVNRDAEDLVKDAFIAGYQAAKDYNEDTLLAAFKAGSQSGNSVMPGLNGYIPADFYDFLLSLPAEDQLADADKVMPQWISVKEQLPPPQTEVLWWNKTAHQAGVSSWEYMSHCDDTMIYWGDAGNVSIKNFTHWMPLPKPPEDK